MSVMNGFHKELLDKIVGINGHLFVQAADPPFTDYDDVVTRIVRGSRRDARDPDARGRSRRLLAV